MTRPRAPSRLPDVPLDPSGFEAEAAALAILGNLKSEGPASARDLLTRIEDAARIAGEPVLPFKHATLYAVLHELTFHGSIVASAARPSERKIYAIASRGRAMMAMARERWRAAQLVIDAASTTRENVHL